MYSDNEIFVHLLRSEFEGIVLEADSIHFPYHLNNANIPQIYQDILVGVYFFRFSVKIRVSTRIKDFQITSLPKVFEMIHKLNLVLDTGSIKYDEKKRYIYFSNYLNREGYTSETLSRSFLSTIFISIKAFEKIIEFWIKNHSEDIADYEKEFEKNPLDIWLEKNKETSSSDGSDDYDESSYDYEKCCNKSRPEMIKNNESVIKKLQEHQDIWELCDYGNFNEETFEYEFNPIDLLIVRLKKYKINKDFLDEVQNFMVKLWKIQIVFKYFPLDCIMASVNEGNIITAFRFALKFAKPLEDYKNGISKFNNIKEYKKFIGKKISAAITKEYNKLYPESLLRIEDFTEKEFRNMKILGKGGCGKVFKNTYKSSNIVAIKYLNNKVKTKMDPSERILHEFSILKELENQYIIKVHGLVEIGKKLCLVMEYCKGDSLKSKISLLHPKIKLNIMKKVAIALSRIHKNGIIHCDIKPSNILLSEEYSPIPKIIDFGLAMKEKEDFQGGFTKMYASPEQLSNNSIDYSTDVWSYGMTYYQVLENKIPFENLGNVSNELLLKNIKDLGERPKFSEEISKNNYKEKEIIEKCWSYNKDKRISLDKIIEEITEIENSGRMG